MLMAGRYGRFYACVDCPGTRGARMDGSPRQERGTAEQLAARHKARDAIHRLYEFGRDFEPRPSTSSRTIKIRHGIFEEVLENAGVPLSPPSKYNFSKGSLWMPRVDYPPGLWLRKRSVEECLRIEAAAHKMLRSLRNSSWDRLAEDDDTSSIVPAVVTCPKSCAPEM